MITSEKEEEFQKWKKEFKMEFVELAAMIKKLEQILFKLKINEIETEKIRKQVNEKDILNSF